MRLAAAATRRSEVVRSRQPLALYRHGGLCIGPQLAAAVYSVIPKGSCFVLGLAASCETQGKRGRTAAVRKTC